MQPTKIERVKKLCKWLIYKGYATNDSELAKLLGYTKSGFSQFMNQKKPLTNNFINRLADVDKSVNKNYILDGIGEMFKNEVNSAREEDLKYIIQLQKEKIENLEGKIKELENKAANDLENKIV